MDLQKFQKNFDLATKAEEKYDRENDAKLRAVEQRVASYDEFKELVQGSHLRPLEKQESWMTQQESQMSWNKSVTRQETSKEVSAELAKFFPNIK